MTLLGQISKNRLAGPRQTHFFKKENFGGSSQISKDSSCTGGRSQPKDLYPTNPQGSLIPDSFAWGGEVGWGTVGGRYGELVKRRKHFGNQMPKQEPVPVPPHPS